MGIKHLIPLTPTLFKIYAKISIAFCGILLMPIPAGGFAQSLGQVARQYQKERETLEKQGRVPVEVFTNDDVTAISPAMTPDSSQRNSSTQSGPRPQQVDESGSSHPEEITSGEAKDGIKSEEYWQARFKAARAALRHAKEEQTLVEDELRLLQIQQARELDPDRARKLSRHVDATTIQLESSRAATKKAQQVLEQTEKEFKKSGAPQNWVETKQSPD